MYPHGHWQAKSHYITGQLTRTWDRSGYLVPIHTLTLVRIPSTYIAWTPAQRAAPQGCLYQRHHCLRRSNGYQLPPFQQHSATVSRHCMHALFFQATRAHWPIKASILFTSNRFPFPVFNSRASLVERQIRICIDIACHLLDTEEIAHARSAFCSWFTGSWRRLDNHFETS